MKYLLIGVVSAAALVAAAFAWTTLHHATNASQSPTPLSVSHETGGMSPATFPPIDAMVFVDRRTLSVLDATTTPSVPSGTVVAGVVNHHVLAVDLLASFWNGLAAARPDATRIILLSPDHFGQGASPVSVHERTYRTDFGDVQVDTSAMQALARLPFVGVENGAMFEHEHGIGALIPFLRYAFPHATIVPIAIRASIQRDDARTLGDAIAALRDAHTILVVSSDMSHYLDEKTALANDVRTRAAFTSMDAAWFATATDDFTDNGPAFVALTEALQDAHPRFTLWAHGISTQYGGAKDNTTSYLTGVWTVSR